MKGIQSRWGEGQGRDRGPCDSVTIIDEREERKGKARERGRETERGGLLRVLLASDWTHIYTHTFFVLAHWVSCKRQPRNLFNEYYTVSSLSKSKNMYSVC